MRRSGLHRRVSIGECTRSPSADQFLHRKARIERRKRVLEVIFYCTEHVTHGTVGKAPNILPGEEHLALRTLFEPYEAMAKHHLPTTGFAHESHGNAFRNAERHTVHCLHIPHHALEKPLFSPGNAFFRSCISTRGVGGRDTGCKVRGAGRLACHPLSLGRGVGRAGSYR